MTFAGDAARPAPAAAGSSNDGPGEELSIDGDERDESPLERVDRNAEELVQELRVAGTGIQVLFAFLLVIPFYNRFPQLSRFDRDLYFFALLCIAVAAVMLIAPSVHHRLLFRLGQKPYLVNLGNRMLIIGSAFLAVGLTAILVLISNVVFTTAVAVIAGAVAAATVGGLWFALPLAKRRAVAADYSRAARGIRLDDKRMREQR